MKLTPKDYQKIMVDHVINNKRCGLAVSMGLGKTSATLTALNAFMALDDVKILVIAPLQVAAYTWEDEVNKWANFKGLRISKILGTKKNREKAMLVDADIYTINYEALPWLVECYQSNWFFDVIVCDESTKLKGFRIGGGGKQARALAKVAHQSERIILLTGTPTPNGLADIWGQQWFVDRGKRLGSSFKKFKDKYVTEIRTGKNIHAVKNTVGESESREIASLLSDCWLTLRTEDYFDLEQHIHVNIDRHLPDNLVKDYKRFEREFFLNIESTGEKITAINAAALSSKCLQFTSGAMYDEDKKHHVIHDLKFQALDEIMEELDENIIVVYQFQHEAIRLRERYKDIVHINDHPDVLSEWNKGDIRMLMLHPASAGHGLSMQHGGRAMIFLSQTWNLEHYLQVIERIGAARQMQSGYKRSVYIYSIITKDTIDEVVQERCVTKKSIQDVLLARMALQKENPGI